MDYTQSNTHGLAYVNAGLRALRREISRRVPSDFDVSFIDNLGEVALAYVWTGDSQLEYQETIQAETVEALLAKWALIDWNRERREAMRVSAEVHTEGGRN